MTTVTLSALWIYPVKSLAGIALAEATITQAGLLGDREWMIIDEQGTFVTQRKLPRLATIKTRLSDSGTLQLTAAEMGSIRVPIPQGDAVRARVWRDECLGVPASPEVNQWLSQAAASSAPLTLVYFAKQHRRPVDAQRFGAFTTHFADAAPFLVANDTSLQALNTHLLGLKLPQVDMRRFRPNIVIQGLSAFHEHQYSHLKHERSEVRLSLIDHCQRCSIITVNQTTGESSRDTSPFPQLAQINSMPGKPKAPAFGVNAVLLSGDGLTIRCGDHFTVTDDRS